MTPKEAIKHTSKVKYRMVEYSPVLVGYVLSPTDAEWFELTVEALEKQIPKKPFNFNNLGFMAQGQCPCCTYCVTTDSKYCDICGQALDWSGEK